MGDSEKRPLFDFGGGIEFGQRLFGFCVIAALAVASLVLHACGVIDVEAFKWAIGTAGTVAAALAVGRSIQKAAREKANATVEIGEAKDAIGFKLEDDA